MKGRCSSGALACDRSGQYAFACVQDQNPNPPDPPLEPPEIVAPIFNHSEIRKSRDFPIEDGGQHLTDEQHLS